MTTPSLIIVYCYFGVRKLAHRIHCVLWYSVTRQHGGLTNLTHGARERPNRGILEIERNSLHGDVRIQTNLQAWWCEGLVLESLVLGSLVALFVLVALGTLAASRNWNGEC